MKSTKGKLKPSNIICIDVDSPTGRRWIGPPMQSSIPRTELGNRLRAKFKKTLIVADFHRQEITILNSINNMAKTAKASGSKASAPIFNSTADQMNAQMDVMQAELDKLRNGTKASAARARGAANELKKLSLQIRKEIQSYKDSL